MPSFNKMRPPLPSYRKRKKKQVLQLLLLRRRQIRQPRMLLP